RLHRQPARLRRHRGPQPGPGRTGRGRLRRGREVLADRRAVRRRRRVRRLRRRGREGRPRRRRRRGARRRSGEDLRRRRGRCPPGRFPDHEHRRRRGALAAAELPGSVNGQMSTIPSFADVPRTPEADGAPAAAPEATTSADHANETWTIPEGIDVKRVYERADREAAAAEGHPVDSFPGLAPFMRGPYPTMYTNQPWTI